MTSVPAMPERVRTTQRPSMKGTGLCRSEGWGGGEPDRLGRLALVQQARRRAVVESRVRLGQPRVREAGAVACREQRRDREQVAQTPLDVGVRQVVAVDDPVEIPDADPGGERGQPRPDADLEPLREPIDALSCDLASVYPLPEVHPLAVRDITHSPSFKASAAPPRS